MLKIQHYHKKYTAIAELSNENLKANHESTKNYIKEKWIEKRQFISQWSS